jgi:NADH-quinone oxidoreductase subunit C
MSEENKEPEKGGSGEPAAGEATAAPGESDAASGGTPAEPAAPAAVDADAEREAKIKAAAEAREARARAKAEAERAEAAAAPKEPSPKQPMLDRAVSLIKERVAEDAVQESYINELDAHLPYLIIKPEHWPATAELLKNGEEFRLNYLRNLSGTDQETHLEVAYHLISLETKVEYCVKIKTDRETPSIPSVTPVWATANWNEREVFDLLGVDFPGHPDLRRIMMPDDWVGHPLRKD